MLFNTLSDIPTISLLRSDRILIELLQQLIHTRITSNAYVNSVKDFYPNRFRRPAMEKAMNNGCIQETLSLDYDYSCLDDIYTDYFEDYGTHQIRAKSSRLERYSSLINKVHPFNIIGYHLATSLDNANDCSKVRPYTNLITPLAFSNDTNDLRYSDNHVHLYGANENLANILELLDKPTDADWYKSNYIDKLPRINMFTHINNGRLTIGGLIDIAKIAQGEIHRYIIIGKERYGLTKKDCLIESILSGHRPHKKESDFSLHFIDRSDALKNIKHSTERCLLSEVVQYYKEKSYTKQWFVYNILLHHIHMTSSDKTMRSMVKIFFHISNILRSYQVMNQNIGLGHFTEFFSSEMRHISKDSIKNSAENIIMTGTQSFEVKIGSSTFKEGKLTTLIKSLDHYFIERKDLSTKDPVFGYHLCIHFNRQEDEKPNGQKGLPSKVRHEKLRLELKKEALRLDQFMFKNTGVIQLSQSNKEIFQASVKIDVRKLTRSLDIAGDETLTPPEVFAPAIRHLVKESNKLHQKVTIHGENDIKGLRLSVHAGEDFNHILTGMRRIHETILFYDMQEYDRLGHALAIGLDPKEWIEINGDIFMTKLELLDDLVWLIKQIEIIPWGKYKSLNWFIKQIKTIPWGKYKSLNWLINQIKTIPWGKYKSLNWLINQIKTIPYGKYKLVKRYEEFVEQLSEEIYSQSYSADSLFDAWKLRRYCPIESFSSIILSDQGYLDEAKIDIDNNKGSHQIFHAYHMDPDVRRKGDEIIRLRYAPKANKDYTYICDDDLMIIHAIQDLMIEDIGKKQLIIETNPTSNIYIAQIERYGKHPIFRWHPIKSLQEYNKYGIRTIKVKVCINTDDPAIMPTTLLNEFEIIKNTAMEKYDKDVESWLDDIRKMGNKIFDEDHQDFTIKIP